MAELPVILVVEDDQLLQSLVEETLSDGGFEVAIASSGEEAVTLLSGNKNKYRALVTDINRLGKLDGWEVSRRAREIEPNFPVVYMSGAHADEWASKGVPNSIMLSKPFAPAQLITAVSQLLKQRAADNVKPPDLFRAACNMGLEGLVSKRKDCPYRAGSSPHWVKVKNRKHPAMNRARDFDW